jgi:diacylglycerol kinase (ATP)
LINPIAGRGRGSAAGTIAARVLEHADRRVRRLIGRNAADSLLLAKSAIHDGVDTLVVVGGDGMVHLALQLLGGTDRTLGIIPAGSGNDIARTLGIPLRDPAAAAAIVAHGTVRTIDLGQSEGTWFGGVVAAGFDALVNERANRMRGPSGRARYNLAMLAELRIFRPIPYRIHVDNQMVETEAMLVAVANARSYGGGMLVVPDARLDDGLLDLFVVHPITKAELLQVFPRVYRGTHVTHPAVEIRRAASIRLDGPVMCTYVDGEPLGPLPRAFTAVPNALRVLVPEGDSGVDGTVIA